MTSTPSFMKAMWWQRRWWGLLGVALALARAACCGCGAGPRRRPRPRGRASSKPPAPARVVVWRSSRLCCLLCLASFGAGPSFTAWADAKRCAQKKKKNTQRKTPRPKQPKLPHATYHAGWAAVCGKSAWGGAVWRLSFIKKSERQMPLLSGF